MCGSVGNNSKVVRCSVSVVGTGDVCDDDRFVFGVGG